jgi:hypothetical protein
MPRDAWTRRSRFRSGSTARARIPAINTASAAVETMRLLGSFQISVIPTTINKSASIHVRNQCFRGSIVMPFSSDTLVPLTSAAKTVEVGSCFGTAEAVPFPKISAAQVRLDGMVSYPQDQSQKPRARAPALHTKPISTLAGETPALLTSSRWCFRSSCTCSNRGIGGCACKNTRSRKTPRRRTPTSEGTPLRSHPPRKNELRNTYRVTTTLLWLFSHSRPPSIINDLQPPQAR